jgi:hypothetical protein
MKTKLLALAFLVGCGDKEETTVATPVEAETQEVQTEETPTTQTEEVVEETQEQVVEETATEEITTNVEGEESND